MSYDPLDRLSTAAGPTQTQGWTYDANGNRMTETGTQATTYAVSASSNRLTGTAGFTARAYSYDAVGNARTYEDVTLTYNNRNRLASTQKGATTRSYVYNALGQMIRATGGAADTVIYVYDEAGHLLGEYTASGARIQETVWLGDIPIATLRGAAAPTVYYVHADHLNTPTRVTRTTDNARQWQWSKDPFGTLAANSNPEGLGDFAYNLRFPGQIFDPQAGLHQNWNRDYSPAIGRYVESDPIGLRGGINTYRYGYNAPLEFMDPTGLISCTIRLDGYSAPFSGSTWTEDLGANWKLTNTHVEPIGSASGSKFLPLLIFGNALSSPIVTCQANLTHSYRDVTIRNRKAFYTETCTDECSGVISVRRFDQTEFFDSTTRMRDVRERSDATQLKSHYPAGACMQWLGGLR